MGHSPVSLLGACPCAGPHMGLPRGQHLAHRLRAGALSSQVKDVHPQPPHGLCPPENQEAAHNLLEPDVSASNGASTPVSSTYPSPGESRWPSSGRCPHRAELRAEHRECRGVPVPADVQGPRGAPPPARPPACTAPRGWWRKGRRSCNCLRSFWQPPKPSWTWQEMKHCPGVPGVPINRALKGQCPSAHFSKSCPGSSLAGPGPQPPPALLRVPCSLTSSRTG